MEKISHSEEGFEFDMEGCRETFEHFDEVCECRLLYCFEGSQSPISNFDIGKRAKRINCQVFGK